MVEVHGASLILLLLTVVDNSSYFNTKVKNGYFGSSITRKSKKNYHGAFPRSLQRAHGEPTESLRRAHISNYKMINNKLW